MPGLHRSVVPLALVVILWARPTGAQVDQERAAAWFKEAAALCAREGGRIWGRSLCGPMVIADPITKTRATNQPAPDAPAPAILGYANAAMRWGDVRWSTYALPMIPAGETDRARLFLHELFHRIQPDLGLLLPEPRNDHLETLEGRYWLRLEWRALARALGSAGADRGAALADAAAFRAARHRIFPAAAENERVLIVNEGLAQYTGIAGWARSPSAAAAQAVQQLEQGARQESLLRNFAYASGAADGVLLDQLSPGWPRRFRPTDNLGELLMAAAGVTAVSDPEAAAGRYGGAELRSEEERREAARVARVADLTRRFIDGPVLVLPPTRRASFTNNGMMPMPGAGTIYPSYRTTAAWGHLEAAEALLAPDRSRITVPAPTRVDGSTLTGDGWTLTISPGWAVKAGPRAGDLVLVREGAPPGG